MHYYERNIGDYYRKAGRLNILQHGVYNLLMDACYDRESFPTLEEAIEWVWAETEEEIDAVKFVLKKFFKLNEDGVYIQNHIKEELEKYRALSLIH
ncbi:YdaU family protein, partial [Acinetobacter baumannii]